MLEFRLAVWGASGYRGGGTGVGLPGFAAILVMKLSSAGSTLISSLLAHPQHPSPQPALGHPSPLSPSPYYPPSP